MWWLVLAGAIWAAPVRAAEASWRRIDAPRFTVYTQVPDKQAQAWAGEFHQFTVALERIVPAPRLRLPRLTVVLFKERRSFKPYLPAYDVKGAQIAGYFQRSHDFAVIGLAESFDDDWTRRTIFHEGVHWFLSAFEQPNPPWMEEGLAEVFSTFRVVNGKVRWGEALDHHVTHLRQTPRLPLAQLLATPASLIAARERERAGVFYAQSWAFVHYLLFGVREGARTALADYIRAYQGGQPPDRAFEGAFGADYPVMDQALGNYLNGGRYLMAEQALSPEPATALQAVPAAADEVQSALGYLALAVGRLDLAEQHARSAIAEADARAGGYELLGQVEGARGREEQALAAYAAALERGTKNFRVLFELGQANHRKLDAAAGAAGASPQDQRKVVNYYEAAINLYPLFEEAYVRVARLLPTVEPLRDADGKFLEQGRKLFPRNHRLTLGLARLAKRNGDVPGATALVRSVLEAAPAPSTDVLAAARGLEEAWEREDVGAEVRALIEAGRGAEALARIEQALAVPQTLNNQNQLVALRRTAQHTLKMAEAKKATEERRWDDARRALQEILDSDAPGGMKMGARRNLERINSRPAQGGAAAAKP